MRKALAFPKPGDIFQELMEKYHGNDIDLYYAFGDGEATEYDFAVPAVVLWYPHL